MLPLIMVTLTDHPADFQKVSYGSAGHTNLAVFMILFMFCAIEVVVLKITTAVQEDLDYSSEYEDDPYEDRNNNSHYHRARHLNSGGAYPSSLETWFSGYGSRM